jgi:nicotinamide-nucleotide amidase
MTIEEIVVKSLEKNEKTLAIAESCTGGMVTAQLVNVSGSSNVLDRGIVTYSNRAKEELLGVKHETLEKYGAVSHETAKEMAQGVRNNAKTDIGLSTTGIAGPNGGTAEKPVGLVYIGISDEKSTESYEYKFVGDRNNIREQAAKAALEILRTKACSKVI